MLRFRLFGVTIQIEFLFVALVTIFLLVDQSGIATTALLVCLIHELGHILMFFLVGFKPHKICFDVTGICLVKPTASLNYAKEVLVQLAGSTTNFILFAIFSHTVNAITPVSIFAVTNLVVGIFNLLPLKSFDGGKLLEITLLKCMSIRMVDRICNIIDLAFIFLMLIGSVYLFITAEQSFTLIVLTIYLMFTAIIKLNQKETS